MTDHSAITGQDDHVRESLSDYLNGDLPDNERTIVENHLESCARCRSDHQRLRQTVSALRQLPPAALPRDFSIPAQPLRRPVPIARFRLATAALAAVLVALIGAQIVFRSGSNVMPAVPTAAPAAPAPPAAAPAAPIAPAAAAPTSTATPAAAAAPAAAPARPAAPPQAQAPVQDAPATTPKSADVRSVAAIVSPTTGQAAASANRVNAVSQTPTVAPYPPAASVASAPNPTGAYPMPASSGQPGIYPAPVAPGGSSSANPAYPFPTPAPGQPPSSTAYPPSATQSAGSAPSVDSAAYPPPAPSGGGSSSLASPTPLTAATGQTRDGETTWFTPALGILGGLVFITAAVLLVLGRRAN